MHHRMLDEEFLQRDLTMERGNNLGPNRQLIRMQQRRLAGAFGTAHRDVVQVGSKGRQLEIQSSDLSSSPGRLIRLLDDLADRETLKACRPQVKISRNRRYNQHDCQSCEGPSDRACYFHNAILKSLPDRDVVLQRMNAGNRIQIASDIEADGPNRSGVAQANSYRVGVIVDEAAEVDRAIDVSPVVEDDPAQRLVDVQRETEFRVQDQELPPAHRHGHIHASRLSLQYIAEGHQALRTTFIDRKTAQRCPSPREEQLAGRNNTVGE